MEAGKTSTMGQRTGMRGGRSMRVLGVVLGVAGALLDFNAGYYLFTQSYGEVNNMGTTMMVYDASGVTWGVGLLLLGVLVLGTAAVIATGRSRKRMVLPGTLMVVYGVLMLLIGGAMYYGVAPMMSGSTLSAFGMFGIGVLMILNGSLMTRREM